MVWNPRNLILIFGALFIAGIKSYKFEDFQFTIIEKQSGFHRTLCYKSLLPDKTKISSVLIKESLPKDMYIDLYEVSGNDGIIIKDLVDCEVPAYIANSQEVMFCTLSKTGMHEICIPVHFRYQVPHNCKLHGESVIIKLNVSTITVKQIDNYSNAMSLGCFKTTGSSIFHGVPSVHPLSFKIPVGCIEDFYSVLILCAVVIPLSGIYLSLNMFR